MEKLEILITFGLFTLIWLIQTLHYPTFLYVDKARFSSFSVFHANRISYIVVPLMMMELALGLYNLRPHILGIVILIWLSTFFIQVPCHNLLKSGFDEKVVRRLISTNWIRTILWSLKLVILIATYMGYGG